MSSLEQEGRLIKRRESPWRQRFIDQGVIDPCPPARTFSERAGLPCLKLDDRGHAEAARQIANYYTNGPAWDLFMPKRSDDDEIEEGEEP